MTGKADKFIHNYMIMVDNDIVLMEKVDRRRYSPGWVLIPSLATW